MTLDPYSVGKSRTYFCTIALLLALVAAGCAEGPSSAGVQCGTERWPVKTLSDSDAARVNFTPVASSVAALRSLAAPATRPQSSRVAPAELTEFSLTAQVVEFKQEGDRDVHLVIAEPGDPAQTMIVEFPDADRCAGAVDSAEATQMRSARAALTAAVGEAPAAAFRQISGTAEISGVGFFDSLHGQTGVAPNGIELHPVLEFRLAVGADTSPARGP